MFSVIIVCHGFIVHMGKCFKLTIGLSVDTSSYLDLCYLHVVHQTPIPIVTSACTRQMMVILLQP